MHPYATENHFQDSICDTSFAKSDIKSTSMDNTPVDNSELNI
jgi:hypothetical protein